MEEETRIYYKVKSKPYYLFVNYSNLGETHVKIVKRKGFIYFTITDYYYPAPSNPNIKHPFHQIKVKKPLEEIYIEFTKLSQNDKITKEELDKITEGAEILEEEGTVHFFKPFK
jgi:beta-N-acetylglucosaminidase